MPSLNDIVARIADPLGKTEDFAFKLRLKDRIKDKRSIIIRRDSAKHGISNVFTSLFEVDLIKADKTLSCNVSLGCPILISKNTLPRPVRMDAAQDFLYVGEIGGGRAWTEVCFSDIPYIAYNKYTSQSIRYAILQDKLVVYNNLRLKKAWLNAAWENPEEAINYCNSSCYNDDMEFPISRDILDSIINDLLKENGAILPLEDEKEIKIEENGSNTRQQEK